MGTSRGTSTTQLCRVTCIARTCSSAVSSFPSRCLERGRRRRRLLFFEYGPDRQRHRRDGALRGGDRRPSVTVLRDPAQGGGEVDHPVAGVVIRTLLAQVRSGPCESLLQAVHIQ